MQSKARQVLDEIEQQAAGRLVRVKQLQDKGQYAEATDLVTELISRYAGTQKAAEGAKMLTKLADRPEIKTNQRTRRAQDLLAQAKEAYSSEKFSAPRALRDPGDDLQDSRAGSRGRTRGRDPRARRSWPAPNI